MAFSPATREQTPILPSNRIQQGRRDGAFPAASSQAHTGMGINSIQFHFLMQISALTADEVIGSQQKRHYRYVLSSPIGAKRRGTSIRAD